MFQNLFVRNLVSMLHYEFKHPYILCLGLVLFIKYSYFYVMCIINHWLRLEVGSKGIHDAVRNTPERRVDAPGDPRDS